ncbi:hypothetical protein V8E51_003049 [Hyaloscypha variabilis]
MEDWRRRFGHIGEQALLKLVDEVQGMNVIDVGAREFLNCETCRLTNSKGIISRRPRKRSAVAYDYVHFDLIEVNRLFGEQIFILHFMDDKWGIHLFYHILGKSQ